MKWTFLTLILSFSVMAADQFGYLDEKDQKFFKNETFAGNNQMERIDLNVREINKLHSEIASLKAQMATMKQEIEELKKKK